MSKMLSDIIDLVISHEVKISSHGYDELAADKILVREIISDIANAVIIEDYPDYPKLPVSLFFRETIKTGRFMSFGESPKVLPRQPFLSQRTDQMSNCGRLTF